MQIKPKLLFVFINIHITIKINFWVLLWLLREGFTMTETKETQTKWLLDLGYIGLHESDF